MRATGRVARVAGTCAYAHTPDAQAGRICPARFNASFQRSAYRSSTTDTRCSPTFSYAGPRIPQFAPPIGSLHPSQAYKTGAYKTPNRCRDKTSSRRYKNELGRVGVATTRAPSRLIPPVATPWRFMRQRAGSCPPVSQLFARFFIPRRSLWRSAADVHTVSHDRQRLTNPSGGLPWPVCRSKDPTTSRSRSRSHRPPSYWGYR
jgi:hypothetical protein